MPPDELREHNLVGPHDALLEHLLENLEREILLAARHARAQARRRGEQVGLDAGATEADQQVHGVRGSLAPAAIHQLARHVAQSHVVLAEELVPAAAGGAETGAVHHRAGRARARAARDVRERDGT